MRWATAPQTAPLISPVVFLHDTRCSDRTGMTCLEHLQNNCLNLDDCSQDEPSLPAESRSLCPLTPHLNETIGSHTEGNLPDSILDYGLQQNQYLNRSFIPLCFVVSCYSVAKHSQFAGWFFIQEIKCLQRMMLAMGSVGACLSIFFFSGIPQPIPQRQDRGIEGWGFGGSTDIRALL